MDESHNKESAYPTEDATKKIQRKEIFGPEAIDEICSDDP
jgi:hypothetical protein